jgi:hypothetical protein
MSVCSFGTAAPPMEGMPRRWWEPDLLTRSWVPVNLLGAMYLQFYWVMTSSGDLSRCKYCSQIISRAPSVDGSAQTRKPRNKNQFSDSRCRYNYHYHNRIKPARQGNNKSNDRPKAQNRALRSLCRDQVPKRTTISYQQETRWYCRCRQVRG